MYQEGTDHLIWSNYDLDLEDWRESLEELYPHYSEDELYEKMYDSNAAKPYFRRQDGTCASLPF